jgi:hypothetical protein
VYEPGYFFLGGALPLFLQRLDGRQEGPLEVLFVRPPRASRAARATRTLLRRSGEEAAPYPMEMVNIPRPSSPSFSASNISNATSCEYQLPLPSGRRQATLHTRLPTGH